MAKKSSSKSSTRAASVVVDVMPKPKPRKKVIKAVYTNGTHSSHTDTVPAELDNRELLRVLTEVRNGNFSVRMPFDQVGLSGKIFRSS